MLQIVDSDNVIGSTEKYSLKNNCAKSMADPGFLVGEDANTSFTVSDCDCDCDFHKIAATKWVQNPLGRSDFSAIAEILEKIADAPPKKSPNVNEA